MLECRQYALLPPDDFARCDIAEYNLACAAGFAETAQYPAATVLERLDFLAREAKRHTDHLLPQFRRKRYDYGNSEPYFRCLAMVSVLERDYGIRYNPAKIPVDAPFDANDYFITGAILGDGGTCSSLPVVVAAVGRRLGYPIKLVTCLGPQYGHVFARWDDGSGQHLNLESHGRGLVVHPDSYYHTGMYARTAEADPAEGHTRSKARLEELSMFLENRSCLLHERNQHERAANVALWAAHCTPAIPSVIDAARQLMGFWHAQIKKRLPARYPKTRLMQWFPMLPPTINEQDQQDYAFNIYLDRVLADEELERLWWGPLRFGHPKYIQEEIIPWRAEVSFTVAGLTVQFHCGWGGASNPPPRRYSVEGPPLPNLILPEPAYV